MARPSDWSPVDMDRDPTPGDPDEVRELAEELGEFADDVGEALGKIRGMAGERAMLDWAGLSADAFRREFDGVPDNLTKLEDSYSLCSQALHTYWPKLQTAQGMADRALDRAVTAQADLASAQSALGDATDWVGRAGDEADRLQREGERDDVEPPDEADVRSAARDQQAAEAAAGAARSRVNDAEERLSAARQLARDAQEMREEAARECARDIDEASDAGIQNRRWWEKAIKWVTDNWDTLVEICKVIVAVLGIVVMIIGGPLAWVVLAAALVVLADTLIKYARGEAGLLDVAFAALDCIPGMKGLTTLGGLARGLRGAASTGLRGLRQGALGLGRRTRGDGVPMNGRNACGDPVDVATGELLMSATDVELPGILPLVIERHHISSYRDGRWFGASWASTLDQRLVLDEHGARFLTADGMTLLYPRPLPDEPVLPVEGPRWTLSWDGQPEAPLSIHQRKTGRTLHFAPTPGRPGNELPLIAITDRNNNRIQLAYDHTGAPTDLHHSGGYHLGITTTHGRVTALHLLNAPDQPTLLTYGYDQAGLLAEITNSSGLPLKFSYDQHHRMSRWEDRNGYWYSYDYDTQGRCVHTTGTDRALEYRYAYDPANHRTIVTDSLGHDTVYQFNDSYQLTAQTNPLGHTTTHTWDRYDHTLTTTNPLGHTTHYTYNEHGDLTAHTRPDGSRTQWEYNELGLPTTVRQPDGAVWQQTYDDAGNRTTLLDPANQPTRYTYHHHGGLASIETADGAVTRVTCGPTGLTVSVIDPLGGMTGCVRDAFGRVAAITDATGGVSRINRTVEGRPLQQVDQLGNQQHWTWDAEGNCLSHTDENGGVTRNEYGPFDLLTGHVSSDGARYVFHRDTELRVVAIVNPLNEVWRYTYDPAGRLVREEDFDGHAIDYRLDPAGQLVERRNALGQTVTYAYDELGLISDKQVDGIRSTFRHDPQGRLVYSANPDAELVIARDALGRVTSESVNGRSLVQEYDRLGRPLRMSTPGGRVANWSYDLRGLPLALNSAGESMEFDYDHAGREVGRRLGADFGLTQRWDSAGRLVGQQLSTGERPLRNRTFSYRADHFLTSIDNGAEGGVAIELDAIGRVTAMAGPARTEQYSYDVMGNLVRAERATGDTPEEFTYQGTRVSRAGRCRYSYDAAGRTVRRQRVRLSRKPDNWQYEWDAEDRLVQTISADGTLWRYQYDPLGRRIAKVRLNEEGEVAEEILFAWSGTTLAEQASTMGPERGSTLTWLYQGTRPLAQITSGITSGEVMAVEATPQQETDQRFHAMVTDLVGTPTELVTAGGEIVWKNQSSLWGFSRRSVDSETMPLRFPGQYADKETGWHYNYHRHYDPDTARYTTPDPTGLSPAPNHYAYVHNPHSWCDPLGLAPHPPDNPGGTPPSRPQPTGEAFPDRPLPRDRHGNPQPDVPFPHTQLGRRTGRRDSYPQAREFDGDGNPVRDVDFTDHNRPANHENPHQHNYEPNPTGGTPQRGPAVPLEWPS
ncbi:hypothetical protein GCM10022227_38690 [Streptomyces sedi]